MVGARSGSSPGTSRRSSGSRRLLERRRAPRTAGGPRRRGLRRPDRCLRTASRCRPATAAVTARARARRAAGDRALDLGGERVELPGRRRVGVEVALRVAHDADLGGDVEGDLASPPSPTTSSGRAAADVDHQQPLAGRCAARSSRARSSASSSPSRMRASKPKRVRTASANSAPFDASAHRGGHHRRGALGAVLRDRLGVLREHAEHRLPRASPSAPPASTPSPSRVTTGGARPRRTGRPRRRRSAAASSSSRCRRPRRGSVGLVRHRLAGGAASRLSTAISVILWRVRTVADPTCRRRTGSAPPAADGRRAAARGR